MKMSDMGEFTLNPTFHNQNGNNFAKQPQKMGVQLDKESNELKTHLQHVVEAFKNAKNCEMVTPPIVVESNL
jgi:hypothetical protein